MERRGNREEEDGMGNEIDGNRNKDIGMREKEIKWKRGENGSRRKCNSIKIITSKQEGLHFR